MFLRLRRHQNKGSVLVYGPNIVDLILKHNFCFDVNTSLETIFLVTLLTYKNLQFRIICNSIVDVEVFKMGFKWLMTVLL